MVAEVSGRGLIELVPAASQERSPLLAKYNVKLKYAG